MRADRRSDVHAHRRSREVPPRRRPDRPGRGQPRRPARHHHRAARSGCPSTGFTPTITVRHVDIRGPSPTSRTSPPSPPAGQARRLVAPPPEGQLPEVFACPAGGGPGRRPGRTATDDDHRRYREPMTRMPAVARLARAGARVALQASRRRGLPLRAGDAREPGRRRGRHPDDVSRTPTARCCAGSVRARRGAGCERSPTTCACSTFARPSRRPREVELEDQAALVEDDRRRAGRRPGPRIGADPRQPASRARHARARGPADRRRSPTILSVSASAVETLLFRARRSVREQLEGALTCAQAEQAISRQLDGSLPRAERGQLRAHLRQCEPCAHLARSLRAQRRAMRSLASFPSPARWPGASSEPARPCGGVGERERDAAAPAATASGVAHRGGGGAKLAGATLLAGVIAGAGYEAIVHHPWSPAHPAADAQVRHGRERPREPRHRERPGGREPVDVRGARPEPVRRPPLRSRRARGRGAGTLARRASHAHGGGTSRQGDRAGGSQRGPERPHRHPVKAAHPVHPTHPAQAGPRRHTRAIPAKPAHTTKPAHRTKPDPRQTKPDPRAPSRAARPRRPARPSRRRAPSQPACQAGAHRPSRLTLTKPASLRESESPRPKPATPGQEPTTRPGPPGAPPTPAARWRASGGS